MLYILYGEDDFSLREALAQIKEELGDKELVATNTTVLQGQHITAEQLTATCNTLPFLAPKRLVIVEGLLSRFEQRDKGKPSVTPEALGWQSLKEYVSRMPESTVLVLIDSELKRSNPMLMELAQQATVREFVALKGEKLKSWMQNQAKKMGYTMSTAAMKLLADLVGSNLLLLSIEINKLCLYAKGGMIGENDVRSLVAYAQETSVFAMVDAVLERRSSEAIRRLHRLENEGEAPPYLLFMITRQFRLVMQAKDLLYRKQPAAEIGRSLGITRDFALRKTIEQARKHSMERLKEVYSKLLETDISIKTGRIKGDKGELALDLLLCELCE